MLSAGGEFDPLGAGFFAPHELHFWKPDRPGRFRIALTCDFRAPELDDSDGPIERESGMPAGVRRLLTRVPAMILEAALDVDVLP
jgi:hypothetical protein